MADRTKISWTDHTFNPWLGCQQVSQGCDNCYAETLTTRYGWTQWGPEGERKRTSENYWKQPIRWNRRAGAAGTRDRVFCPSMADVFDNQAPGGAREDLWELIRSTPNLDWQLLTKRPQNFVSFLPEGWNGGYANVWLGVSVENQEKYNRRWPILEATPSVVRFISYEPALGPLRLDHHGDLPDWLIWGGESGPGARLMDPAWARAVTAECLELGIPVFGKQWGNYRNNPLLVEERLSTGQAKNGTRRR